MNKPCEKRKLSVPLHLFVSCVSVMPVFKYYFDGSDVAEYRMLVSDNGPRWLPWWCRRQCWCDVSEQTYLEYLKQQDSKLQPLDKSATLFGRILRVAASLHRAYWSDPNPYGVRISLLMISEQVPCEGGVRLMHRSWMSQTTRRREPMRHLETKVPWWSWLYNVIAGPLAGSDCRLTFAEHVAAMQLVPPMRVFYGERMIRQAPCGISVLATNDQDQPGRTVDMLRE